MKKNLGAAPMIFPQPVLILATYDENGTANAMNAAWGGIVGNDKIIIELASHKTTDNIMNRKAFTVSIGDKEHMLACDYVGIVSGNKVPDKMEKAGFTTTKSEFVDAPVINELPVALECELIKVLEGSMYFAKIVNIVADDLRTFSEYFSRMFTLRLLSKYEILLENSVNNSRENYEIKLLIFMDELEKRAKQGEFDELDGIEKWHIIGDELEQLFE